MYFKLSFYNWIIERDAAETHFSCGGKVVFKNAGKATILDTPYSDFLLRSEEAYRRYVEILTRQLG